MSAIHKHLPSTKYPDALHGSVHAQADAFLLDLFFHVLHIQDSQQPHLNKAVVPFVCLGGTKDLQEVHLQNSRGCKRSLDK
jgi:hypothetical protein